MKRLLLLLAFLQVLLISCSVKQQMELNLDSSGNAELNVEIHPIFRDYLLDISDVLSGNPDEQSLFDLEQIKETIAAREGMVLNSVSVPENRILHMNVSFTDVEVITSQDGTEDVFSFSSGNGVKTLDFHLTASNFRSLFTIAAMEDSPLIDTFGPSDIAPWTEQEYLENVPYALEENGSVPEIQKMFREATVQVTVNVKGEVVSQKGGVVNGKSVVFTIPMLRILTLVEPLDLQIVYK